MNFNGKGKLTLLLICLTFWSSATYCQFTPIEILGDVEKVLQDTFLTRRGLTSDWYKFIFGFQRGGLKVQTRLSQNCFTDGMALLSGLEQVGLSYLRTRDMDIFYNADDIWLAFNTKCNLLDTVEGTIFLNFLANHVVQIDKSLTPLSLAIRALDLSTIIMDLSDLSRWYNSLIKHRDPYNWGTYAGKAAKLLTQAYMSGLIDVIVNFILFLANGGDQPPAPSPVTPPIPPHPVNPPTPPSGNSTVNGTNSTYYYL